MQKKIGTLLEESLIRKAKEAAHADHTTLNHIFEAALAEYLGRRAGPRQGPSAVEASFGAIPLPLRSVRAIEREDAYGPE